MDGAFGRNQGKSKPIINITPLIDVMFLLLIFFMVSSTFRTSMGIDIALPQADTTGVQEEQAKTTITVRGRDEIFINSESVTLGELEARLQGILDENPENSLVLEGDKDAVFENWIGVIDVARKVGGKKLVILTEPAGAGGTGQQ